MKKDFYQELIDGYKQAFSNIKNIQDIDETLKESLKNKLVTLFKIEEEKIKLRVYPNLVDRSFVIFPDNSYTKRIFNLLMGNNR